MTNTSENLRAVLDYFGVTASVLAKTLGVDPSLISRWLNGERALKASGAAMDALAEYILECSHRVNDLEWLAAQFRKAGLPTDISSVYQIKHNLIVWLASDGDSLRRNLGGYAVDETKTGTKPAPMAGSPALIWDRDAHSGFAEITCNIRPLLEALNDGANVDIFLSNDEIATVVSTDMVLLLIDMIEKKRLLTRILVCVSGNTKAMTRIIDAFMKPLISGQLRLSLVHGMTQSVTHQMHMVLGPCAVLVTETPGGAARPVAAVVDDDSFVQEIRKSFEYTMRFAQPAVNVYDDNYSRNILEILYTEFAMPGNLDVVKDSINPMYMNEYAYDRLLAAQERESDEFAWRSAEFARFKSGMDEILRSGTVFREILSLARLNQIAQDGFCRMPGLYFMKTGFVNLDSEGCAAILKGYIQYLNSTPNFQLLILDDLEALHQASCWHVKQNASVAVNVWSGDEPLMIQSDQVLLIREFQSHFDALWDQGKGYIGSRANVITTLQDVLKRLTERFAV